jgi:hypothetical protein
MDERYAGIKSAAALDAEIAKARWYEESKKAFRDQVPLQATSAAGAGMVGSMEGATEAPDVRWQLENRLSQLLREADGIQALLDTLPAKVPPRAAHALRLLILK